MDTYTHHSAPPEGDSPTSGPACVGCGWCCLHDQCDYSHRLHGYVRRCPELVWDRGRGRYLCALVGNPEHDAAIRGNQFIDQGCCARANPWRAEVRFRG
jgi:hypothetical protein